MIFRKTVYTGIYRSRDDKLFDPIIYYSVDELDELEALAAMQDRRGLTESAWARLRQALWRAPGPARPGHRTRTVARTVTVAAELSRSDPVALAAWAVTVRHRGTEFKFNPGPIV